MSNAKLKEQIEAAKIALVHSAEAGSYADKPSTSGTVTQIPGIGTDHTQPIGHIDREIFCRDAVFTSECRDANNWPRHDRPK